MSNGFCTVSAKNNPKIIFLSKNILKQSGKIWKCLYENKSYETRLKKLALVL